jgi:hypothetical protein
VDRPPGADPVPNGFDWDFWIGPAPWRPFKEKVYHPGTWRGWYDFGGGSLADFCCHGFNLPVRALKLDYPTKIEIAGQGLHKESFITSGTIRFYFPARGNRGPVTLHFHTGGEMPGNDILEGLSETFGKVSETGCLLLGKKGTLSVGLWNSDCYLRMKGEPEFKGGLKHEAARSVSQTLPRTVSQVLEWVEACRKGSSTFSDFDIGGHITEIGLAGVVALRLGHDIDWDGEKMEVRGLPDAAALIKPDYREGFTL